MRVAIHTLGTRGDVQPYLALARGFRAKGHEVLLIAPVQFAEAAGAEDLVFAPLPSEFLDLLDTPEIKDVLGRSGTGFGAGFKLIKYYRHLMRSLLEAEWEAAQAFRPDVILYHPKALGAPHIAVKLGVPVFLASPLPGFTPTAAFPTPILPVRSLGPLNRMSHALMIHGGSVLFASTLRNWREHTLGLPARGKPAAHAGTLYGYSPRVVPKPMDWGRDVVVAGYWFLDTQDWQPDADLANFLNVGEAPIYVGFGSMPGIDPEHLTSMVIEGLRRTGKRGLLATAGGALGRVETTRDVHVISGAPHDRLFPCVHATLHHGGAGTTGAALRAGKPTAICPFFGDQPFWARHIAGLGVGPEPLDKKKLTADDLAAVFRAMDDKEMRTRVETLGRLIEQEDGVTAAIAIVEKRLEQP
ncbi:MAG: glycosyltransferase family 1 protein [Roseovarius sp.]|nr:glycosyltransferase family 1 protein [Roseovarius sp.]